MALPRNRTEFKEHCLRRLGKPVIEINVDDTQVEDRIDEALEYYFDYHFDGTHKVYLKHQITANNIAEGSIDINDNIRGIVSIFPLYESSVYSNNMFSARYQFELQNIPNIANYNMLDYFMARNHMRMLEEHLTGLQPIRFNRHLNKLKIDTDWKSLTEGDYIIIECYQALDPNTDIDIWKDRWLIKYATEKIKYQWGSNLSKFSGMQLPGGITFNGERIMAEANEEIKKIEEEMISSYSIPVSDMIG